MQTTKKKITTTVLLLVVIMHFCTPFVHAEEIVFDNEDEYLEAIDSDFDPDNVYILQNNNAGKTDWFDRFSLSRGSSSGTKAFSSWGQDTLNMIDLNSIPEEVYEIIHSDNRLIVIQVWSSTYRIFVLRNGYIFTYLDYDTTDNTTSKKYSSTCFGFGTRTWTQGSDTSDSEFAEYKQYMAASCCWSAVYKYDGTISTAWTQYTANNMNSNYVSSSYQGKIKIYTGELSSGNHDFYQIGASNFWWGSSTDYPGLTAVTSVGSNTSFAVHYRNQITNTFDMTIGSYLSTDQLNFPTFESQTNDTQKGILQRIKELPEQISDMLTTLKNYLLYFSSEEVERSESPFADVLTTVDEFIDERLEAITLFREQMNSNLEDVEDYILIGSDIIDDFLDGVTIIETILVFVLAIVVIRKVVGR